MKTKTTKGMWYSLNIRQLVQAEMAASGVPTRAELQSMIVHEMIDHNAEYVFPVLCKQIEATIENALRRPSLKKRIYSSGAKTRPYQEPSKKL